MLLLAACGGECRSEERRSEAAPAASDKHRLLHRKSREGLSRVRIVAQSLSEVVFATSHPQPCRTGKPARIPGRAYRTPRQRLRISAASFIGSREKGRSGSGSWLNPYRKSSSRLLRTETVPDVGRRLEEIPGRAYRKSRRAVLGPDRGSNPYRKLPSRLLRTETVPDVGRRLEEIPGALIGCRASDFG